MCEHLTGITLVIVLCRIRIYNNGCNMVNGCNINEQMKADLISYVQLLE